MSSNQPSGLNQKGGKKGITATSASGSTKATPTPAVAPAAVANTKDAAFIPPTRQQQQALAAGQKLPMTSAASKTTTPTASSVSTSSTSKPAPPPPDPKLNGPDDWMALFPLTLITLCTLYVLFLCAPSAHSWHPPVNAHALFLGFEWPGRGTVGGAGGWSGDGGSGLSAGEITFAEHMGVGGVTPGTRSYWPFIGRKAIVKQIRTTFTNHPLVILTGPRGSGRTAIVGKYVDSTRGDTTSLTHANSKAALSSSIGGTTSEYNVILWLDASNHDSLFRQYMDLHAYLRLHTMQYDRASILANILGWLYKQERWLIIFDNCSLDREELLQYTPKKGGHIIVVLTPPSPTASNISVKQIVQGFDLSSQDVIRVPHLPQKAGAKLLAMVSGVHEPELRSSRLELTALLKNHTASIVTAGLYLKRHQAHTSLPELIQQIRSQVGTTSSGSSEPNALPPATRVLLSLILNQVWKKQVLPFKFRLFVLNSLYRGIPVGSTSIPRELLLALVGVYGDEQRVIGALERHFNDLIREMSLYGLISEHSIQLGTRVSTQFYLPPWFLDELRLIVESGVASSTEVGVGASSIPFLPHSSSSFTFELCEIGATDGYSNTYDLLTRSTSSFLAPLIHGLGISSSSGYLVPTPSVVAANPQYLPPHLRPYESYLTALSAIVDDDQVSPLSHLSTASVSSVLHSAYGGRHTIQTQDERGAQVALGVELLEHLHVLLGLPQTKLGGATAAPNFAALSSSSRWPSLISDKSSVLNLLILYGCYQLDVLHEPDQAQAIFQYALKGVTASQTWPNPFAGGKLVSKNHLNNETALLTNSHSILLAETLPLDTYTAALLSLIGVTCIFQQEGGTGSATATSMSARLTLDLALNYQLLALEMKKTIYAERLAANEQAAASRSTSGDTAAPLTMLHPSVTSTLSQLAHVYALQRDLEQAKATYGLALKHDLALGGLTHLNEEIRASMMTNQYTNGTNQFPKSTQVWSSTNPQHHLRILLHQLKFIRDLSMLAHEETVLFYYSNAQALHLQAYQIEVGLYTADSLAGAARWMQLGHNHIFAQQPKEAYEYYESCLEYHKAILDDQTDLRLIHAHFLVGESHNALGRGRTGKKAIEQSLEMHILARGGEINLALVPSLEVLGDTCYALGQHQDALGYYKRLMLLHQILFGESHERANIWKQKVMNMYQVIQQINEEQKRKQQQAQQEQYRKLQEQRAAKAEEERQQKLQQAKKQEQNQPKQKGKDEL